MFSFNFLSDNNLNNIYLDIFQSKLNSWKLPKLILRLPSKIQTFPRLLPVHPSVFFGYDFELVVGRSLKIGFRLYLRAKCMTLSNLPGSRIQENCCLCVRGFLDSWVPGGIRGRPRKSSYPGCLAPGIIIPDCIYLLYFVARQVHL